MSLYYNASPGTRACLQLELAHETLRLSLRDPESLGVCVLCFHCRISLRYPEFLKPNSGFGLCFTNKGVSDEANGCGLSLAVQIRSFCASPAPGCWESRRFPRLEHSD
jgi:hypothetical protein